MKKGLSIITLFLLVAFSCEGPSDDSGGDARVTIYYYVGTQQASSARIEVNGGLYTMVAKNTMKVIQVNSGDNLRAEWTITTSTGTTPKFKTTVAEDGLEWEL